MLDQISSAKGVVDVEWKHNKVAQPKIRHGLLNVKFGGNDGGQVDRHRVRERFFEISNRCGVMQFCWVRERN